MTFAEMTRLEPNLRELEQRMRAIKSLANGLRFSNFEDLLYINGFPNHPQEAALCFAPLEVRFTESLLRLVGPGGMHPLLKDADVFSEAHRWLWRNFPSCNHEGSCVDFAGGETVLVDFSGELV